MLPFKRCLSFVAAAVILVAVASARADDPRPPTPRQLPLAEDVPPPVAPVVRPAPPPVPAPVDSDEGGDTVLGSRVSHGGYGAPSLKVSSLAGDGVMLAGAEGGWIIGRTLVLGGAGYGSVSNVVSPATLQPSSGGAHLNIGYGGFRFGGIVGARKLTHVTLGVLLGGGSATSETANGTFRRSDDFFVIEPDLAAEINIARHVRFALGGSYRFVGGTDDVGFTSTRLSGPAALVALRFGEF